MLKSLKYSRYGEKYYCERKIVPIDVNTMKQILFSVHEDDIDAHLVNYLRMLKHILPHFSHVINLEAAVVKGRLYPILYTL